MTDPKAAAIDPKLEDKKRRLEQLRARQQRIEQRIKYLASRQVRKDDTRRKILIGAIVLAKIEQGEFAEKQLRRWLDQALTRQDDRALFDLPPVDLG
jgi:hypothetical protein